MELRAIAVCHSAAARRGVRGWQIMGLVLKTRGRRFHHFASRAHRWLALIVGAQVLIWFASGALMSFLPIGDVRGEHLVDSDYAVPLPAGLVYADPARIASQAGAPIRSIEWRMAAGRSVAVVTGGQGAQLFDAVSAERLGGIDAAAAQVIARSAWKAPVKPAARVFRVTGASTEYRGSLPAWRVAFADPDHTSVFVSATTGEVTAVRTGTWRLYDFVWGLHIMDWKNHEDFNTWWLLAAALGALLLGLAGTALLVMRWPWRKT